MSDTSENIKSTFENMVKIYEELARLFLDADDLMARNGHRALKGSALESETSRSLNSPRWWLMFSGVRYYVSEDDPQVARAIGVFFYDGRHEPMEPIVVIGAFSGEDGDNGEDEINPFGILWEAWMETVSDQALGEEHEVGEVRNAKRGKLLALPLTEVSDFESLETKVVNPLLDMEPE